MTFNQWLDTFLQEKNLEETTLEVEGLSGTNFIPVEVLAVEMKSASTSEQQAMKHQLVLIDFRNGSVTHFLTHIAQAIAI